MEDSFKVRVDRAFGSLQAAASSSSSSVQSSLWCLTDEEIERNKWLQDPHKDNDYRPKPFLQGFTSNQDLDDDEDDDDENRLPQLSKPEDHSNEEWDIRSSVGMDCTLDNEEEEDAFDKVAVGKEDRFYMKDVNDYEVDTDNSFTRDPRANHTAAKLRLKEDDRKLANIQQQLAMNQSVPDYVCNPSKYTHYTFDSMDNVDEESNRNAYMALFNSLKGPAAMEEIQDDVSTDSVIFTPRRKSSDVSMKKSKADGKKAAPISINADSDEVCIMDEDEPTVKSSSSLQKRYRTKDTTDAVE